MFRPMECFALSVIKLRITLRTIDTIYGVHPEPIRTSVENHFEWFLLASNENLSKDLDVSVIF